jgi:hypothetical protein
MEQSDGTECSGTVTFLQNFSPSTTEHSDVWVVVYSQGSPAALFSHGIDGDEATKASNESTTIERIAMVNSIAQV